MKNIRMIFVVLALWSSSMMAGSDSNLTAEQQQYIAKAKAQWESLTPQKGEIKLANGVATLHVPEAFYYLSPKDAETVLVDIWGNPPNGAKTLGMLFPEGATPFDRSTWGVTIEYNEDGYVSDENADEIDYDGMLSQMKEDTSDASKAREKQGYPSIELVGWASKPYYDQSSHKLHWAKEIKFGGSPGNTLNYDIRILGRKGVLILSFIAGMDQLSLINSKIDTVLNIAEFDEGSTYADFNPDMDTVATYGLGALIAGKVAAKLGILATILIFLKKFWIIGVLGLGGLFKRFFGKKEE